MDEPEALARMGLDQLLAGLRDEDPAAIEAARQLLHIVVRDATPFSLSILLVPVETVLESGKGGCDDVET